MSNFRTDNHELYIQYVEKEVSAGGKSKFQVPLKTLIVVFSIRFSECQHPIKIVLVHESSTASNDLVWMTFDGLEISEDKPDPLISAVQLPLIVVPDKNLVISGLCSVIRHLLKKPSPEGEVRTMNGRIMFQGESALLGFQGGCLSAPAEVSTWTRFCEVDFPSAVAEIASGRRRKELPEQLAKFEMHLAQPIRIHNIRKRMQQEEKGQSVEPGVLQRTTDEGGNVVDPIVLFAQSQHIFAEGPDLLLSDVILFIQYAIVRRHVQLLPRTKRWFGRIVETTNAEQIADELLFFPDCDVTNIGDVIVPTVPNESLYKSDPKRKNPASRVFTRQGDIDRVFDWFQESGIELASSKKDSSSKIEEAKIKNIDWNELPELVHPMGGNLPPSRLEKKCQQLENLASVVVELARPGDVIVDFCSGGGHLGIIIAYLLPSCRVYLVENKDESLRRAISRVHKLGLANCTFFQCNLDYFRGRFDIGVSLHACGVATDLVLKQCTDQGASFVSCPCCYGSVQENHILSYPRSKEFSDLSVSDYLVFGHTADQTHVTNEKHEQGQLAMDVIDTDRASHAEEEGYEVVLTKLKPTSCTPKNNLIVGWKKRV